MVRASATGINTKKALISVVDRLVLGTEVEWALIDDSDQQNGRVLDSVRQIFIFQHC